MSIEEFKHKMPLTIGAIVWIAAISFSMGMLYSDNMNMAKKIITDKKDARDYTEQEVGGLRSDWERHNEILKESEEQVLKRIDELEKYHKK